MKKLIVLLLACTLLLFCPNQLLAQVQKIDSALTALYQSGRFNGVVLYAEHGKPILSKTYGVADFQTGKPLSISSPFNLASVTKQFICAGILILYDRGLLKLDDPAKKHLPALPYPEVTIRQLMTHTSGLPEYFDLFNNNRGNADTLTNELLLELLAQYRPPTQFAAGSSWSYCNTNYVLLASIIEKVSGQRMEEFFKKEIIRPLGLKNTYIFRLPDTVNDPNQVKGFREENGQRRLNDLTFWDGVVGDGNLFSSAEDLLKWEQQLYKSKIIKPATLAMAFQPVPLNIPGRDSSYPYGFGWGIDKPGEQYSHTGGWTGFVNIIMRDVKKKRTLILLSSGSNPAAMIASRNWFNGKPVTVIPTRIITNVKVMDGTGTPARNAAVRLEGDRIMAVGELQPFPGELVEDGGGKILTPGFIDTHSHLEGSLQSKPQALAALNQGITTIVAGQDGYGSWMDSLEDNIKRNPPAINVATYTGQTGLREKVMGEENLHRTATKEELEKMKTLLAAEMKKGSLGLSTGLEYAGAWFSSYNEVLELAKVAAFNQGRYISHLRSEDIQLRDAIEEIISIGKEARIPVQISHLKIALKNDWKTAPAILARLERARQQGINITADVYPYEFWRSTLKVLFPKTDYTNEASAEFAVTQSLDPSASVLVAFKPQPEYRGKTLSEVAALRNETPARTLMALIAEAEAYRKANPDSGGVEGIMGKSMTDADVSAFLSWQHTNICSDGADGGHPRGYGSFTRVLTQYVREKKIMSLETAINKMTALSAEHVGIRQRGLIAAGYYADLVLLDPDTVQDHATIQNPQALSDGILKVWVNGELVYANKEFMDKFPGRLIKR
ncbi:MAG: serine hydrolase [Flavipsychrobacter sp.]|nr:serine hydrolase [Flavipsychrobacter sp.]